jgi:polysaccharide export outer membrane protein
MSILKKHFYIFPAIFILSLCSALLAKEPVQPRASTDTTCFPPDACAGSKEALESPPDTQKQKYLEGPGEAEKKELRDQTREAKEGEEKEAPDKEPEPEGKEVFEEAPLHKQEGAERVGLSAVEKILSGQFPTNLSRDLNQFGYKFFDKDVTTFSPLTNVPVGPDYIVGPGDSFTIHLWGRTEASYNATVNRDGSIVLPRLGSLPVSGLTFAELKEFLLEKFNEYYPNFQMSVTMERLRTINIFIVGEARRPGTYEVSSLSTVITALYAAGGPNKNGSLRNIEVFRQGDLFTTLDLYEFFIKGVKTGDIRLQNGDTIFIPVLGPVVGVAGNARRPAIYEMKGAQTIGEMIKMAGGVLPTGCLQNVVVERVEGNQQRIIKSFNLDPASHKDNVDLNMELKNFDVLKIYPIFKRVEKVVYLEGHVKYPREYELKSGMRLRDLIDSYDDLLPVPYLPRADIIRLIAPDLHYEVIKFNLGQLLAGEESQNLVLKNMDRIIIYDSLEKASIPEVTIRGAVRRPGTYTLYKGMRIRDLIFQADNLTKGAYLEKAAIIRTKPPDPYPERIEFSLGAILQGNDEQNFLLKDLDQVVIYDSFEMTEVRQLTIRGAVHKPGVYPLYRGMKIRDLILEAGAFSDKAFLEKATLSRVVPRKTGTQSIKLEFSPQKALAGLSPDNIPLEKDDVIYIRQIPKYDDALARKVYLEGEFIFPGEYSYEEGERISSVIQRAGGLTEKAYPFGALFFRESVKRVQEERLKQYIDSLEEDVLTLNAQAAEKAADEEEAAILQQTLESKRRLLDKLRKTSATGRMVIKLEEVLQFSSSEYDIELRPGDRLIVNARPDYVNVLGEVFNPTALLAMANKTVGFYLKQVGGSTEDANKGQIYLVKADGTVVSKSQEGFFGLASWDSKAARWTIGGFESIGVDPGDTIIVPKQIEKYPWLRVVKDITQIMYQIAVTAGIFILSD